MELHVDRLTLDLPALSEADGRRLAWLLAECLAAADVPGGSQDADRLRLSLVADPGESVQALICAWSRSAIWTPLHAAVRYLPSCDA